RICAGTRRPSRSSRGCSPSADGRRSAVRGIHPLSNELISAPSDPQAAGGPCSAPSPTGVGAPQEENMKSLSIASALVMAGLLSAGLVKATEARVTCKGGPRAAGGRGACRGQGGVDKSATAGSAKSAPPAAEATAGAAATVTCKDGASSKAGRGACRGHGGVAKSETGATGTAVTPHAKRALPPAPATPPPPPPIATSPPAGAPRAAAPRRAPPPQVAATTHGKAASTDPTGAIARCRDGVYWHSASHRGACSRHGGVESWTDQPRQ